MEPSSAALSAGGSSFPWSLAGSIGFHVAVAGGVAWFALAGDATPKRGGHVLRVESAPLAAAVEPEHEPEPMRELELSTPDEPQLIEVDLPPQPLLVVEQPSETPADVLDSTRAQSRLLSLEWNSRSARRANAVGGEGGESAQGSESLGEVAPPPEPPRELVVTLAERLDTPDPLYPRLSRRLAEQGTVELRLRVLADGTVGEIVVTRSSGFERLDEAAREGVRVWRFRPATSDGVAVDSDFVHRVTFRIEGA
jgi:protein TonB